jgi:uncharacterized protein YvpB
MQKIYLPKAVQSSLLIVVSVLILACTIPGVLITYSQSTPVPVQVIIRPRNNNSPVAYSLVTRTPFLPLPTVTETATITATASPTATDTPTITPTITSTSTDTLIPTETETPPPTETEIPESFQTFPPEIAQIDGLVGYPQISTLDCEARSAVDFAAFFGVVINEMDFLALLPKSDDPEAGFVGNYWDPRGQLPPNSYGVHALPVAALLRSYGLNAWDIKGFSYNDLQREIASGRPVIAWVVGNTIVGEPVSYSASIGNTTTVARFEHTVIVVGYQPSYITVVDGDVVYHRSVDTFLNSWGVLGNMVIVYRPE